jgi:hypothetical protein
VLAYGEWVESNVLAPVQHNRCHMSRIARGADARPRYQRPY